MFQNYAEGGRTRSIRGVTRICSAKQIALNLCLSFVLLAQLLLAQFASAQEPITAALPEAPAPVPKVTEFAKESPPASSDALLATAREEALQGSFASAETKVRTFLSGQPESADGHVLLGYILYLEVHPKESLSEYTLAARHRTPTAVDLEIVALDYVLLGDFTDADRWLTKSLAWAPANAEGWYYLGRAKYNENQFEQAIDAFLKCLSIEPRNVKAEDNLGLSYQGLNRPEEAKKAFQTAIAWQQEETRQNPQPYLNLGELLSDQGNPQSGLPYLLKATELAPRNPKAHEQLGRTYLRLKQATLAQAELEAAVRLAPENASLHFELGLTYRDRGLKVQAKREFDVCATLNATHSSTEIPNP